MRARREEVKCRFCDADLPDWKPILTPAAEEVAKALPTMSVTFNGQVQLQTSNPLAPAHQQSVCNNACKPAETALCVGFETAPMQCDPCLRQAPHEQPLYRGTVTDLQPSHAPGGGMPMCLPVVDWAMP